MACYRSLSVKSPISGLLLTPELSAQVAWLVRSTNLNFVPGFAMRGIIRLTDDLDPRYETGWL